jgi:hypothetical protein
VQNSVPVMLRCLTRLIIRNTSFRQATLLAVARAPNSFQALFVFSLLANQTVGCRFVRWLGLSECP